MNEKFIKSGVLKNSVDAVYNFPEACDSDEANLRVYSNHSSEREVDIALAPAESALITSSLVSIRPPAITGMSVLSAK